MGGVEILNQFEAVVGYGFNFKAFSDSFIIIIIIGAFWSVVIALCESDWVLAIYGVVISVICALLMGAIIAGLHQTPTKYETHYQVIITDEVKMSKFYERYEILEQEGRIYTVREK